MPVFETPGSIAVTMEIGCGDVRITASDRTDTVVEVRPSDEADDSDVRAAQQVRVDYTDGTLRIVGPKHRAFSRGSRSVDVSVELPSHSQVSAELQAGDFRSAGPLGRCRLKIGAGSFRLERTGPLHLSTSAGHVTAGAVGGDAEISTGTGRIQLGEVEGGAVVKNSNGETTVDAVAGDLRVRSANGDIRVGRAGAGVDAKTSNGSIHLGEVVRGTVVLGTPNGDLDIGIAEGTAAWLSVDTGFGHVRNELDTAAAPDRSDETVEVRGHTSYGDITVRRA
jgi:DUF4097 and DUF4098 domain-containing protein YvlB